MDRGVSAPESSSRADNVGPARLELGGGRLVTVGAVLCGIMVAVRLALAGVAAGSGEPALIPWLVGGALVHALALAINRLRWPGLALVVGYLEVVVVSLAAAASTPVGATFALYVVAWAPVIYISPLWQHRLRHLWLLVAVLATVVIPGVVPDGEAKLVVASATSVGALCVVGAVIGLTVLALERSSAAVHQAQQLREQLEGRDALTGLLTRRRASERIAEEAARARRHGRPFSCVLADLDSFRAFGDRYGAACAEWVLVTVANLMKKAVRSTDAVARWDGQQFLMVLPETDAAGAAAAAERLRLAIEEGSFSFEGREVRFSVTFGVGVSGSLPEATGLAAAEAALAEGKQRGKNRVVIGSSEPDGVG